METALDRIDGVLDRTAAGVLVRFVIPFTPADIAGLDFWGAARLESYGDDDPVGTMTDQSVVGNDATEATNTPTFKTNIINSLPVFRFDGTNDIMTWSTVLLGSTFTAFAVMAVPGTGNYAPLLQQYQAGQAGRMSLGLQTGASNVLFYADGGSNYTGVTAITNDVFHVLTFHFDAGSLEMFIDGVSDKTQAGIPTPYSTNTKIGEWVANWGAMDIAELLVYDSALSAGDSGDVETYLAGLYGLAVY